jgi:hypothetical protein
MNTRRSRMAPCPRDINLKNGSCREGEGEGEGKTPTKQHQGKV